MPALRTKGDFLTAVDDQLRQIGLPHHPAPEDAAAAIRAVADAVELIGPRALIQAAVLAARGYSASTLGDGGSRGTDPTSSTERAALQDFRNPWDGVNVRLAQALQDTVRACLGLGLLMDQVMAHAPDRDEVPAGTANCLACEAFCSPVRNPNNRIKAGLCPKCYRAWYSAGKPNRQDWIHRRRQSLTDESGKIHAPT